MLKPLFKGLFDSGFKIIFRFSSSIALFIFAFVIDKIILNQYHQSWYLEFLLIFPIISSISRFGLPLQILSSNISNNNQILNVINYQVILVLFFSITYLITSNDYFFLLSICPIGYILFNYGVGNIRKGIVSGYLFQNGIIYLIMTITCFNTDLFFNNLKFISFLLIIFCFVYLNRVRHLKMQLIDLKNYFSDSLNSFTIPIIIFLAFKSGDNLDVGDFLIIKSTSLISSALGGLLLLDFNKIDTKKNISEKLNFFSSLKKSYFYFYVLMVILISGFIAFSYYEKIYLLIFLIVFETLCFFKGQLNLLNIYFNNQIGIVKSNFTSLAITISAFGILMIFNFKYSEMLLYCLGIASFQFFSYLNFKKYENL